MKVLKLLDTVDRGGAETQALDICRNGHRFGLDITLISGGGSLEGEFRESGVRYIGLRR